MVVMADNHDDNTTVDAAQTADLPTEADCDRSDCCQELVPPMAEVSD